MVSVPASGVLAEALVGMHANTRPETHTRIHTDWQALLLGPGPLLQRVKCEPGDYDGTQVLCSVEHPWLAAGVGTPQVPANSSSGAEECAGVFLTPGDEIRVGGPFLDRNTVPERIPLGFVLSGEVGKGE